ncbi:hypothetical protein B0H12DRAFT_32934 [Mycena haematopus]|nr:hypothetical protein B0H12DRAFT_32934 [Mycena haematopus]
MSRVWDVFNALCKKVLKAANSTLHQEDIERDPEVLDLSNTFPRLSLPSEPDSLDNDEESEDEVPSSVTPRREYVWRTIDRGQQSLATVADRFTRVLDMKLSSVKKITWTDGRRAHRCPGYVREEITLAATAVDSAVISHDAPSPLEVCSVCNQLVGLDEVFQCICGDRDPGSYPTVQCQICKFWSHRDCVGNQREFICHICKSASAVESRTQVDSSLSSSFLTEPEILAEPYVNGEGEPVDVSVPLEVPEEWYDVLLQYNSSGREITNAVKTAERLASFMETPLTLEFLETVLKAQANFAEVFRE